MSADPDPVILEDFADGTRTPGNAELLDGELTALAGLGGRPATCAEAREMLGAPG